jgi:hypothetical protein
MVKAATERDFNAAFATIVQTGTGALVVGGGPYFQSQLPRWRRAMRCLRSMYRLISSRRAG